MKELDKYCVLLFDEMALEPGLQYNKKERYVDGFEDFGSFGRAPKLADTANVFMLRGIHKQWKQPISFTFSSGSTNSIN